MASGNLPSLKDILGTGGGKLPTVTQAVGKGGKLPSLKDLLGGGAPVAVAAPKKKGGGGFFGEVGHVLGKTGSGLESMATGFGPGVWQATKLVGQDSASASYRLEKALGLKPSGYAAAAHTADPHLFHNTVGLGKAQLQSVEQSAEHPLRDPANTLLNALAVASLGAGSVAKVGSLAESAGLINESSRLAQLGKATDLTAPDFAKRAGQDGADVIVKRSSANPLTRARQVAVNNALNRLPHSTPMVGSDARVVRALGKEPARTAARMTIDQQPFQNAFASLTPAERVAWHLKAQQVHPADYRAFLEGQKNPSPGMLKLLNDPKVTQAFEHPSARLQKALVEGRALADHLGSMKVAAGHVSEQAAAERPYLLMRLVNGAETKALTGANAERLSGREAAVESGHLGLVDKPGRDIPVLARELADRGEQQPFYVPHSAAFRGDRTYPNRPPAGFAEPAVSGTAKQNLGVLARQGKLALTENPLLHEWTRERGRVEAQQLHEAIVEHAAELPKGQPLPHGYEYLKINRGSSSAPYTEQIGSNFEHRIDPGFVDKTFTHDEGDPAIAESKDGTARLVVPSAVKDIIAGRVAKTPSTLYRLLYQKPSSLWKHIIVGLRPASAVNITAGNSILGMLQSAPGHGIQAWLNQVLPGLREGKLADATVNQVFPEQKLGTFGRSVSGSDRGVVSRALHAKAPRAMGAAGKLYQGVMPATIAYENVLRRAMLEGWAKASPEVRAALKTHNGDINAALKSVATSHPQVINEISKRTDDALGDYHSYNAIERQIQQLVPFYGWDRHIVRSLGRIVGEHSTRAAVSGNLGNLGTTTQKNELGSLPSFMSGDVKLSGLPGFMGPLNGRVPLLDTRGISPLSTAADLLGLGGARGSSELSATINPLVQAAIEQLTGSSLLTGAPLPKKAVGHNIPEKLLKIFEGTATGVPQVTLAKALMSGPQSKPGGLYQNDWQSLLAQLLGAKIKKTDLTVASQEAARGR